MSAYLIKEKFLSKEWLIAYSLILLGTITLAVSYVYFINPYKIVPGGIYGLGIIIHNKLGYPIGLTSLVFNIPLTIAGIKILGPKYGPKTIVGFILTSTFIDVLNYFNQNEALVKDDMLLSSVFGGVLIGVGVGLIFKAKATVGGTDTAAMITSKFTGLRAGESMMLIDSTIVIGGLIAFGDWRIPLYSLITIFVMGKLIDITLQGIKHEKALMIISEKHQEIEQIIINNLRRGGTSWDSKGIFMQKDKKTIFTVIGRRELSSIKSSIRKIDPHAFVTVFETSEILGKGFKSFSD